LTLFSAEARHVASEGDGTDDASLSYLKRLSVDEMTIDKGFVGFAHKVSPSRTFIVSEIVTSISIRSCAMYGGPNRTGCGTVGLYGQSRLRA